MSEPNEQYAYFTVTGEFGPKEITQRLAVVPTDSWKVGDFHPRTGLERKFSRWCLYSRLARSKELEEHIADVLAQMDTWDRWKFLDMLNLLSPRLRSLVELAWPPKDLHEPVLLVPFRDEGSASEMVLEFIHRYNGPHTIGLCVEGPIPIPAPSYDWGGRYLLTLVSSSGEKFRCQCGASPTPWWNGTENGFVLCKYSVPENLPLGGQVQLNFKTLSAGSGVLGSYGKAHLYVKRWVHK